MSSHHFVKEGQEPALIIADPVQFEVVESILEWAPLVIVFRKALDYVLAWGIKTDIIITEDSFFNDVKEISEHQWPVKILLCSSADEMFCTALDSLLTVNQRHVNIGVTNPAIYFEKAEKYIGRLEITLIAATSRWSLIESGNFKKWYTANSKITIRTNSTFTVTQGLIKQVGNELLLLDDSFVCIQSEAFFWVGEEIS